MDTEDPPPRPEHDPAGAEGAYPAGATRPSGDAAAPVIRPGRSLRWSWVWLVPLLALAVGLSLLASVWVRNGPVITISFLSAAGVEAGQTKLRYRDVVVGEVSDVRVAEDRQHVLVDVQLRREGSEYITQKDSKFWIVRPQVSLAGVSGLDTLLSGVYIDVDAPVARSEDGSVREFEGLANPPEVLSGQVGTRYVLRADSLGSLRVGSRIHYRRIEVGRVVSYDMAPDGRSVGLHVFVEAPYDRYVTPDTRFWNDSGVDLTVSTDGVQMRTSGLAAILDGGIAFAQADESSSYDGPADSTPAAAGTEYRLFGSRDQALADPDGDPVSVELRFDQSVRGLRVGADIDFRGMSIGKVVDIDLEFDRARRRFFSRVRGLLYPVRFGSAYRQLHNGVAGGLQGEALLEPLIERGLRAQLRTASLLTGQQYVALDFFPGEAHAEPKIPGDLSSRSGFLVPTVQGDFDRLQGQLGNIVTKLDKVPIDAIGRDLSASLEALNRLLRRLDTQVAPQATRALNSASNSLDRIGAVLAPDAPLLGGLRDTLSELDRAARALRLLSDALQARPDALIRGRAPDELR
ncbi:Paraquat-inducible protein B [Castellaniella defragrans 65Phen]|uniref:Paraquat-inducible protein B n=1 Tax=Castellaniella defragrans (strain DSM 12143 / CCUG 39792 / 65Phen) TaxID=1437824 RepID=W8X4D4_CASD6|nr:MlaD family protein [Castellaniella defragrans]CDM24747.1 Paraquat-inducible protein B [Castellaniella defragrans 65Phen]